MIKYIVIYELKIMSCSLKVPSATTDFSLIAWPMQKESSVIAFVWLVHGCRVDKWMCHPKMWWVMYKYSSKRLKWEVDRVAFSYIFLCQAELCFSFLDVDRSIQVSVEMAT